MNLGFCVYILVIKGRCETGESTAAAVLYIWQLFPAVMLWRGLRGKNKVSKQESFFPVTCSADPWLAGMFLSSKCLFPLKLMSFSIVQLSCLLFITHYPVLLAAPFSSVLCLAYRCLFTKIFKFFCHPYLFSLELITSDCFSAEDLCWTREILSGRHRLGMGASGRN